MSKKNDLSTYEWCFFSLHEKDLAPLMEVVNQFAADFEGDYGASVGLIKLYNDCHKAGRLPIPAENAENLSRMLRQVQEELRQIREDNTDEGGWAEEDEEWFQGQFGEVEKVCEKLLTEFAESKRHAEEEDCI